MGEKTHKPLHGDQGWVKAGFAQEFPECGHQHSEEFAEELLINYDSDHHREIVDGKDALNNHTQEPESLFLLHVPQQLPHHKVQSLAVSHRRVPLHIRTKDVAEF